jgi:DNA-binding LytR/AlgR family response regulator
MSTIIKCIITDDEPIARKGLQGYIEKIGFLQLKGICEDAVQLNTLIKQQPVDLLFLDIEMPYITGIEFLQNTAQPPKVIFTTAYEQYAIKGYELDVLDYLLKPISFDRFLKAANKAYDYFSSQGAGSDHLFIKTDSRLEKINFNDLLFVEAMENYVALYTADKKMITHSTLKALQEKLPAGRFIQPHKSYLVNIGCISSIEGNILHLGGKYQVPVSKYLKEETMEKIVNNNLLKK